ncbi:MAG: zinc ABC transporter substrate-binding protein [Phycisphaerae bacterium]|nr:zinc ABC transporter substrate-binding protein [Phycisphaerae bacterium]
MPMPLCRRLISSSSRCAALTLALLVTSLLPVACDSGNTPSTGSPARTGEKAAKGAGLQVFASNAPLAYFAKRIGDAAVTVSVPPPVDIDPAFWQPTAEDIATMQAADLVILNGAGFEHWRSQVSLVERTVIETAEGFKAAWIETRDGVTHSHGTEGAHSHAGTAFTTWLDPDQAIEQARAIHARLAALLPDQATDLQARFMGLERDLRTLNGQFESAIGSSNGLPLVFSHPIYQYFIRRYELNGRSLHWEPEEMPSESELTAFAHLLKEHPAKWMVWEDEPGQAIRSKLRELGVECVVVAPASNMGPDWERWLERQIENATQFAKVFE